MPNNAVLENYSDIGAEVKQEDYSNLGTEVAPVVPELRNAPPATFIDKMKSFFTDPEKDIAKAQNVYALSEVTGLQLKDVYNNYDLLRRSSKVTGITPDLERREYMAIAMTPFIATAAVLNPIGTTAGLLAYAALDKAIPTDKIIKGVEKGIGGELSDTTKTTIDLLDFLGKGLIVGGVFKQAPKLAEGFMKQKLIEYNLAKDIKLSKEQVRDIFQTGKLTTAEEQSLFGSLNLKGQELRNTLTEGVKITIPAEKLTTLVDKPIWAKIKSIVGAENKPKVVSELAGQPKKAVAGLIEGATTPETPIVAPNKPITAPIVPKAISESLPLAIRLKSGEVISDTTAKLHSDIVTAKGINPDDVVDVGIMKGTEYQATKLPDTKGGAPLETLPKVPEQLMNKVTSLVGEKTAQQKPAVSSSQSLKEENINVPESMRSSVESMTLENNPVKKIIEAIKNAKDIRGQQETLYTKARAEKLAKMSAVGKKVGGQEGYYARLGALKGELPKVEFESIVKELKQEDVDSLFNMIKDSPHLSEWDKLPAFEGLNNLLGQTGGRVPTESQIKFLHKVFGKEFTDTLLEKRPLFAKMKEIGLQIANLPRSIMASFDLSFGLRQGLFMAPRYRKEFMSSWTKQFSWFGSEKSFTEAMKLVSENPNYNLAIESGIRFTEMDSLMSEREERFASQWADIIPGVRNSSRAYTAFANKYRMDTFSKLIQDAEKIGLNPNKNRDLSKAIAGFVNNGTGRGSLGGFERSALLLNSFFFSPRLMASRLNLLNPASYVNQDPFVRKEMTKTLLTFLGAGITILTLAKLMGAEVGSDVRSSDLGKIKIGNTRIDIWGGFQPYIRMVGQLISGEYISSTTGKKLTLGEGYKPLTRLDILMRQIESKEAPVFSFLTDILKGQTFEGKPINIPKEIGMRFIPMVVQDLYDVIKDNPQAAPAVILTPFGVGVQTYKGKRKVKF